MKRHIIAKYISAILALLLLLPAAASCRDSSGEGGSAGTVPVQTDEEPEKTETTESASTAESSSGKSRPADTDGKTVICIDPGHGFEDVGCGSQHMSCYEMDITLPVAKYLKSALEEYDSDINVILTHDGQTYPAESEIKAKADKYGIEYDSEQIIDKSKLFSAYERTIYENILDKEYGLDLFISLHVNSVENADYVDGVSIDYCVENPYADSLSQFCTSAKQRIEDELSSSVKIFADSYEEAYKVNKYTEVPSVLVEMGYATNPDDAKNLQSSSWQKSFAETMCKVITDYIEK